MNSIALKRVNKLISAIPFKEGVGLPAGTFSKSGYLWDVPLGTLDLWGCGALGIVDKYTKRHFLTHVSPGHNEADVEKAIKGLLGFNFRMSDFSYVPGMNRLKLSGSVFEKVASAVETIIPGKKLLMIDTGLPEKANRVLLHKGKYYCPEREQMLALKGLHSSQWKEADAERLYQNL